MNVKMKVGYICVCGHTTVREIEGSGQNRIKHKRSCVKCLKIKRLKAKANKRGLKKDTYLK